MTIGTYQELFHYTAFPIFAVLHGTDKIVYKNIACENQLPGLSKKNSIKPFIFSQSFTGIGPVKLTVSDQHYTAIALKDEEHSVFLFLSYLQCEDGMYRALQLVQKYGSSLVNFLSALKMSFSLKTTGSVLQGMKAETYAEIEDLFWSENIFEFGKQNDFYQVISCVFDKLNSEFSEFGYCVEARIEEDFPRYLHAEYSVQDILFVLGRLLYLQMKLSKTKNTAILLSCDMAYSHHTFHMTAETNLSNLSGDPDELMDWLLSFIPECKMEFLLLFQSGLLSKENFSARIDRFGNLTLLYHVPYVSPETYYVRSMENLDAFRLYSINGMLGNLLSKLIDNGASC
jgi:hypothetical protein